MRAPPECVGGVRRPPIAGDIAGRAAPTCACPAASTLTRATSHSAPDDGGPREREPAGRRQLTASRAQLEQAQQLREQQQLKDNNNRAPGARLLGRYRASSNQSLVQLPSGASHTPSSGSATNPSSRACSCSTTGTEGSSAGCSLHATPTPSDPQQQQQQQQPQTFGQCRICRKTIGSSEPCHLCSNCQQFICDDCASYSSSDQVSGPLLFALVGRRQVRAAGPNELGASAGL